MQVLQKLGERITLIFYCTWGNSKVTLLSECFNERWIYKENRARYKVAGILGWEGKSWFTSGAFSFCMFVFDSTELLKCAMWNRQGDTETFNDFAQASAENAFKHKLSKMSLTP